MRDRRFPRLRAPRPALVAALAAAFCALAAFPAADDGAAATRRVTAADGIEGPIANRIDDARRRHGLRTLRRSAPLARAAASHARSMARLGYFSHSSANGDAFHERVARFYGKRGFRSWTVGETIAWRSPRATPAQTVRMWLRSAPHRRVLLTARFREVGVGAVRVRGGRGVYGRRAVTIVVADFGARRR